jgi:hypothetical protein
MLRRSALLAFLCSCLAGCASTSTAGAGGGEPDASPVDGGDTRADGGTPDETVGWVLSYFGPNQELRDDSLRLAYSTDGLHWTELAGRPVYQPAALGSNHIRDPFLLRKRDGTFVYLATDWTLAVNDASYWNRPSPKIFVVDSADLITFTKPHLLQVTNLPGPGGTAMHAWAPEAVYDPERSAYAILWAGNDTSGANHLYASYTSDFVSVSDATPSLWFDPGYSVIDGTITTWNGHHTLFFKNDTVADIQVASSSGLSLAPGSFSVHDPSLLATTAATGRTLEGPFVVKVPDHDRWYVFADRYTEGGKFAAFTTTDLDTDPASWTQLLESEYHFPSGVRHASAVRVTQPELDALIAHYGTIPEVRLETTYAPGGVAHYVAHSWGHAMITFLGDTNAGQLNQDFLWKVVPGLADPNDPTLVSLEAVVLPDHFLRIDSADPTRYPPCSEASNRIFEACSYVAETDRNDLAWIDPYVDSDTFRNDATFRKVSALNGDASMVSFVWLGDATRYLRHLGFQIVAHPVGADADEAASASFTVEAP